MDDLISRKWLMECVNEGWIKFDTEKDKNTYVHLVRDIAPSAQPKRTEKRTEPHVCDCISRQAALDAIMGQPPEPHYPSWYAAQIEKLPAVQPATNCSEIPNGSDDTISRQAAIDAVDSETVSTNPDYFKSGEKFIEFMDDADIASFGKWQWANGFNTALTVARVQLKKLPSAQPEKRHDTLVSV